MCPAHPSDYAACSEYVEKRTRGDGAFCWALASGAVRLGGDIRLDVVLVDAG